MLITEEAPSRSIDLGLDVFYDGKTNYYLLAEGYSREYPIGGLIAEYNRFSLSEIKSIILQCSNLDSAPTIDNAVGFLDELAPKLRDGVGPAAGTMIIVELFYSLEAWFAAIREDRAEEFIASAQFDPPEMKQYVFEGTGYDELGMETLKQMVLTVFVAFCESYSITRHIFENIVDVENEDSDTKEQAIKAFVSLLSQEMAAQRIDFRFTNVEGWFKPLYTIKSSLSLLVFEIAHCVDNNVDFNKCACCGRIFAPDGRKDQIYCNYPSPQNPEKTCREIGAQITRMNKEKTDVATREYRKVYMRYVMTKRRHPENREALKKFHILTEEVKPWRTRLSNGSATTEQFLEWLHTFD